MAHWIALTDPTERNDYLNGDMLPLQTRETEHGIEIFMPHTFPVSRFTGTRVCQDCGLLPLDYDKVEIPCGSIPTSD